MAAALSALSDIAVFTLLVHSGLFFIYCQAVSRIVGGAVSFFINKHFSFDRHEGRTLIEIRRFLLLYAVSYTLSFVLLWFAHQRWGLRLLYAKPLADGTCFLFNFAVMKLYVYAPLRGLIFRIRALLWLGKGAVDDSLRG
ncbi:MAG: GtrA family protein [Deltaproteobacteria bacterium]|nr:GtrA family protein [Deltaproteobacteria bacterium]